MDIKRFLGPLAAPVDGLCKLLSGLKSGSGGGKKGKGPSAQTAGALVNHKGPRQTREPETGEEQFKSGFGVWS